MAWSGREFSKFWRSEYTGYDQERPPLRKNSLETAVLRVACGLCIMGWFGFGGRKAAGEGSPSPATLSADGNSAVGEFGIKVSVSPVWKHAASHSDLVRPLHLSMTSNCRSGHERARVVCHGYAPGSPSSF